MKDGLLYSLGPVYLASKMQNILEESKSQLWINEM